MKYIWLLFLVSYAQAGTISFIGPCSSTPVADFEFTVSQRQSIGQTTIDILIENNISHLGTPEGINSIFNTPIGAEAMEIISETEMLGYGWCYSVNGVAPEVYPDKILTENSDHIIWWFGFAQYKDGQWITQCTPSYTRKSPKFCKDH